jgi:hypothetical protein
MYQPFPKMALSNQPASMWRAPTISRVIEFDQNLSAFAFPVGTSEVGADLLSAYVQQCPMTRARLKTKPLPEG